MKKVFFVLLFVFTSLFGKSQNDSVFVQNLKDYDKIYRFHYGFFIGLINSCYLVKTTSASLNNLAVNSSPGYGIGIGIVANARLNGYMDMRFIPTYFYASNRLVFISSANNTLSEISDDYGDSYLGFPLLLKLRPKRTSNHRPYLVVGCEVQYNLKKNLISNLVLGIQRMDYSFNVGIGLDNYRKYFKISPELSFSFGLSNLKANPNSEFYYQIDKLSARNITLKLCFE